MDIITQINREDEEEDAQLNAYADKGEMRTAASALNCALDKKLNFQLEKRKTRC